MMTGASFSGERGAGFSSRVWRLESVSLVGFSHVCLPLRTEVEGVIGCRGDTTTESGSGLGSGCCAGTTRLTVNSSWTAVMAGGSVQDVAGGGVAGPTWGLDGARSPASTSLQFKPLRMRVLAGGSALVRGATGAVLSAETVSLIGTVSTSRPGSPSTPSAGLVLVSAPSTTSAGSFSCV